MKKSITILSFLLLFISCSKEEDIIKQEVKKATQENKVLVLKVNFDTNTLEGGKEFTFDNQNETFTTNVVVQSNEADGGNIKVFYQELNQKLFEGTQSWTGKIVFPGDFQPANSFVQTITANIFPMPIFQNIYNPNNSVYDYNLVWNAIQDRVKVREFLTSNPNQSAKLFLFTEYDSAVVGLRKKWIIFFKN